MRFLQSKERVLVEDLGWGGMSLVTRQVSETGQLEVRKEPLPKFYGDRLVEECFVREFEILKELSHPGIVRAIALERRFVTKDIEIPSLVLEEIKGVSLPDLSDFLKNLSTVDFSLWLTTFLGQMTSILRYLNERVVHGDLAPENILITRDGWIKIIDFGTSSKRSEKISFRIAGRPFFRSPEVMATGHAEARDDVFAFGRILRWCLQWRNSEDDIRPFESIIDDLEEKRSLDGAREVYQPLSMPAGEVSKAKLVQITEMKTPSWKRWASSACVIVLALGLGAFTSSWMPQRALLDVNSRPFAYFTFEHEPGKTFETPARRVEVPSGKVVLYFRNPYKPDKMLRREVVLEPLQRTRVFEDFGKH